VKIPYICEVRVLQLFHRYLDQSSNWIYHLMEPLAEEVQFISGSPIYINPAFEFSSLKKVSLPWAIRKIQSSGLWYHFKIKQNNRAIQKYIQSEAKEISLAHAHFSFVGWQYMLACVQNRLPLIVSFYGYDYEQLPHTKPIWKERYTQLFSNAQAFVAEGKHGATLLKDIGCPEEKIYIIPLGVPIPNYTKKEKSKSSLQLIQIANYKEKKGHIYTLEALSKALKINPSIHLTMVGAGEGKIKDQINKYINDHQLNAFVTLIPQIDFSELYTFLTNYDVLIQPSIYATDKDSEGGAPIIIINAQAVGLPIIATYHADIPNIVQEGKTALLASERDTDTLAQHIVTFQQMAQEEYIQFSMQAHSWAQAHFNQSKCSLQLLDLYKKIAPTK
jgi:colanic acid/amylovoran biosynthesis glycosyltransferase